MAKILVIDDEEQIRFLLIRMLTRDGHEVFVAQDGLEGVKSFYDLQPDLVITDIVMPNKDGIELIADLRSSNPNQPIIAMSGGRRLFSATSDLNEIEITGVKRLLQKPFTLQQLRESVDLALG
jgi:DNA-binding response OmpR family regulator